MDRSKRRIAIEAGLVLALLCSSSPGWAAAEIGRVVQLSGPMMVRKADGALGVLAIRSALESGDTLVTQKNTYAMVKFIDDSEITLKPSTTFTVENFSYDPNRPEDDRASFNLTEGGVRSVTGLLGKRSKERFELKTPSASIGVRGTTFIAEVVPLVPAEPKAPMPVSLAPGLYMQVLDGLVVIQTPAGPSLFNAGQFGLVKSGGQLPVIVPQNPGLQFNPPPQFNAIGVQTGGAGLTPRANTVDCEVR